MLNNRRYHENDTPHPSRRPLPCTVLQPGPAGPRQASGRGGAGAGRTGRRRPRVLRGRDWLRLDEAWPARAPEGGRPDHNTLHELPRQSRQPLCRHGQRHSMRRGRRPLGRHPEGRGPFRPRKRILHPLQRRRLQFIYPPVPEGRQGKPFSTEPARHPAFQSRNGHIRAHPGLPRAHCARPAASVRHPGQALDAPGRQDRALRPGFPKGP